MNDPAGASITTWLPEVLHTRLLLISKAREESVSKTARRAITEFVEQRLRRKP